MWHELLLIKNAQIIYVSMYLNNRNYLELFTTFYREKSGFIFRENIPARQNLFLFWLTLWKCKKSGNSFVASILLTSGIIEEISAKRTEVTKIISLKAKFNFENLLWKLLIHHKSLLKYFRCILLVYELLIKVYSL